MSAERPTFQVLSSQKKTKRIPSKEVGMNEVLNTGTLDIIINAREVNCQDNVGN